MNRILYPWPRFWVPHGQEVQLQHAAFLHDPETRLGRLINPGVARLARWERVHFLALLGDPGMGKSTSLEREAKELKDRLDPSDAAVVQLPLHRCGSAEDVRSWLAGDPSYQSWQAGERDLYLYLDDLGEAAFLMRGLPVLLAGLLEGGPPERLFVRVAARNTEWSMHLQERAVGLWGEQEVQLLRLCPLREEDVRVALRHCGRDPEPFLAVVEASGVAPLAAKPQTLLPLIDAYVEEGVLPADQDALYERACSALSREPNAFREEFRKAPLWIVERDRTPLGREIALHAAGLCEVRGLEDELAALALAEDEAPDLRAFALRELTKLASTDTRRRLFPLVQRPGPETLPVAQREELAGGALYVLWPDALSVDELGPLLTPPGPNVPSSVYRTFLRSGLAEGTPTDRAGEVLRWFAE